MGTENVNEGATDTMLLSYDMFSLKSFCANANAIAKRRTELPFVVMRERLV